MLQPGCGFIGFVCCFIRCYSLHSTKQASTHLQQGPDQRAPVGTLLHKCILAASSEGTLNPVVGAQSDTFYLEIFRGGGRGNEQLQQLGQHGTTCQTACSSAIVCALTLGASRNHGPTQTLLLCWHLLLPFQGHYGQSLDGCSQLLVLEVSNSRSISKKLIISMVQK